MRDPACCGCRTIGREKGAGIPRGRLSLTRWLAVAVATVSLGILSFLEVGLAHPVPGWLYALVALVFSVGLVRRISWRVQKFRIGALLLILAMIAVLYRVEWTTRKPFLRDLGRIRPGMNEREVRQIMGRYIEGTGWPESPFARMATATTPLRLIDNGREYTVMSAPSGEMAIRDAITFRHSHEGDFNSDWGIVSFSDGRVIRVEFSPD